jgi:hypothetical protein
MARKFGSLSIVFHVWDIVDHQFQIPYKMKNKN